MIPQAIQQMGYIEMIHNPIHLMNIAMKDHQIGKLNKAKDIYNQILESYPENPDALHLLGVIAYQQGQYEKSIYLIYKAIDINPSNYHYYINIGNALQEVNRFEDAVGFYKKALGMEPMDPMIYNNLGNALQNMGMIDQAIKVYQMSLRIEPNSATTYNNLGTALKANCQFEEAISAYKQAIMFFSDFAEAHDNLAKIFLLTGQINQGWNEYEWRLKHPSFKRTCGLPDFKIPKWDGSPFPGKILLVHHEQGFGDSINFIRYLSLAKTLGGNIIFVCQPSLCRLLKNYPDIDQIVETRNYREAEKVSDYYVPLLSLPYIFRNRLNSVPGTVPYIKADQTLSNEWKKRLPNNRNVKVGVVWSSNPNNFKLKWRSANLESFAPLANIPNVTYISLQKGIPSEEAKYPPNNMSLIDFTSELNDFADTAALIDNLDYIISVDTAVAHLSGAMAKPTSLLLSAVPDWRWLLNRSDTTWYPTMQLFRQKKANQWDEVMCSVADDLNKFVQSSKPIINIEPQKMVNAIGFFNGHTGYNIHTRNFFDRLAQKMNVFEMDLHDTPRTNQKKIEQLNSYVMSEKAKCINIMLASVYRMNFLQNFSGFKIAYAVWETTKIPDDWHDNLNSVDMIWTPSSWGKKVLMENGFPEYKIDIVPEGVDTKIFNPNIKPHSELEKINKFKFIHVGKFEERKYTKQLIKIFDEEFGGKEAVLILICHNPVIQKFDIYNEINKINLKYPEQVILINPFESHEMMASFFTGSDAAVFPSRAEGWGLPIIEAMACGLPTILTNYSGPTEYANESNAYLLDYELSDITIEYFKSNSKDYGKWAEPKDQHLRYLMNYLFQHREESKIKGKKAASDVFNKWTWDIAVEKAISKIAKS